MEKFKSREEMRGVEKSSKKEKFEKSKQPNENGRSEVLGWLGKASEDGFQKHGVGESRSQNLRAKGRPSRSMEQR